MTAVKKRYRVVAARVFNVWEDEALSAYAEDYRSLGRSVRTFTREVRAGGTSTMVHVAVVREAMP
jgi:hypothetical protein